jgi:hypothetical protein
VVEGLLCLCELSYCQRGEADDSLVGALSDYVSVTMWLRRWADDSSGCGYFPRLLLS